MWLFSPMISLFLCINIRSYLKKKYIKFELMHIIPNGWPRNNGAFLLPIFEIFNNIFKIWFWADSIENSFSYKTVEGIFHISLSCRCKILKINIYSIIHLRILIVCRYQSICLSLWSSIPTLKLKYFDINR